MVRLPGSLLVFILARCVRVRQKLVPRNLSATHNLAPDIRFRSIVSAGRYRLPLFLIHFTGRPGSIENSQLVFSYDIHPQS